MFVAHLMFRMLWSLLTTKIHVSFQHVKDSKAGRLFSMLEWETPYYDCSRLIGCCNYPRLPLECDEKLLTSLNGKYKLKFEDFQVHDTKKPIIYARIIPHHLISAHSWLSEYSAAPSGYRISKGSGPVEKVY